MTDNELNFMNKILNDYKIHLKENKNSLINPIYGVFTFIGEGTYSIQRNMLIVDKKYLLSVYDLKGSVLGRYTFKNDYMPNLDEMKTTMKDLDFVRFEKKLHVTP